MGLGAGSAAWKLWQDEGWWNPCRPLPTPEHLANHEFVRSAWIGLDPAKEAAENAYVARLTALQQTRPAGSKLMLLAMDYFHDESGNRVPGRTVFHVPNDYAAEIAARNAARFEWIASIHPYRKDCVEALEWAARHGARAIKWLPSIMGIDPASPRCVRFYDALVRLDMPLMSHGGYEHPLLDSGALQEFNNPLALRRPLERGVRVIVAHCASTGAGSQHRSGDRY